MSEDARNQSLPELRALEQALASLVPRADRLDRDRLMFLAGERRTRRLVGRAQLAWRTAFAAMTAVAASLLVFVVQRPAPEIVERVVERVVAVPAPAENAAQPAVASPAPQRPRLRLEDLWPAPRLAGGATYPALRERLLREGVEAWEMPKAVSMAPIESVAAPVSYRELLDHLLEQQTPDGVPSGVGLQGDSGARL